MNKNIWLLVALLFELAVNTPFAAAQQIQPVKEKNGQDPHGRAIYRVPANGIKIGFKLIGSGEPLVMIPGLAGTMDAGQLRS